jgi:hypothetical protein
MDLLPLELQQLILSHVDATLAVCQVNKLWRQLVPVNPRDHDDTYALGYIDLIKYHRVKTSTNWINSAVQHGQIEVLKWVQQRGIPFDDNISFLAACYGQLEVLKWLYSQGLVFDKSICAFGASSGNIKLVDWLRKQEYVLSESACAIAALVDYSTLKACR